MRNQKRVVALAMLAPLTTLSTVVLADTSVLEEVQPYGLFKPFLSFDENDKTLVSQSTSRLGVRVNEPFTSNIDAFGHYEAGINFVNNNQNANDVVVTQTGVSGDTASGRSFINFPLFTRLGYVALQPSWGTLSIGKQWGVYYDVAGFTDWFPLFGGEATGVYTGGTDGGVTGTGRAGQALQFRAAPLNINIGLQMQLRNVASDKNRDIADTYAGSLTYTINISDEMKLGIGAAYTRNQDGADTPDGVDYENDIALKNADAFVIGLDYYWRKFRFAFTYASIDETELDDEGFPIEADGFEIYSRYAFTDKFMLYYGLNYLDPDDYDVRVRDDDGNFVNTGKSSDYEIKYFDVGFSYNFAKTSAAWVELKLEDSSSALGRNSTFRPTTLGIGYSYAFGY